MLTLPKRSSPVMRMVVLALSFVRWPSYLPVSRACINVAVMMMTSRVVDRSFHLLLGVIIVKFTEATAKVIFNIIFFLTLLPLLLLMESPIFVVFLYFIDSFVYFLSFCSPTLFIDLYCGVVGAMSRMFRCTCDPEAVKLEFSLCCI